MVSNINPANPIAGTPTTQSVRDNFQTAHDEIGALQAAGPYAPLASPALTGNPTAPTPIAGDNDTSIATTAFVQETATPALNNVGRNLIHNSMFNVAQRGAGPWTAAGNYLADRWQQTFGGGSTFVTVAAITDGSRAQIGDEAAEYALANAFVGSATAGSFNIIWQQIEDVRRLSGKTITVSFFAATLSGNLMLGVSLDQNFGSGGSPSPNVSGNGIAVTLGTTWTRYSVTLALPSVAGKTLGTSGDSRTSLNLWHSAEATFAMRSGGVGVQSGTIFLWGVQLEIGSVATPLEKPEPSDDVRRCQRFYQTGYTAFLGYGAASQQIGMSGIFSPAMRASPTMTIAGAVIYGNASGFVFTYNNNVNFTGAANAIALGTANYAANYTASADL